MRAGWRRWPVVVVPLLLVFLGVYTQDLTLAEWDKVAGYQAPYATDLPPAAATARLTDQVILAVVDGLREDTSKTVMPFLNELRSRGSSGAAITGQPSLSLPAVANFGMGTEPEIHGVTTNWYTGAARLDNVFHSARRQGLKTASVDGDDWVQLYGPDIMIQRVFDTEDKNVDNDVLQAAEEVLREQPDLLVVHFASLDTAGHKYGGGSRQYAETAAAIDARLRQLAGHLDLSRCTLIVASDHGHVLAGGHGGWEPEVIRAPVILAGKAIKPGRLPPARQADVGPTIAALLGIGTPSSATGRALLEVLDATDRDLAQKAVVQARARLSFTRAYLQALGAKGAAASLPQAEETLRSLESQVSAASPDAWRDALSGAEALDADLGRAIKAGRAEQLARSRWLRLPRALLAVAIPALIFALVGRRQRYFGPALIWGAAVPALFAAMYFAHGFRFSLSAFNSEEQIKAFFMMRLVEAAVASLVAAVGLGLTVGLAARRRGLAGRGQALGWQAAGAAVTSTAFAVYLLYAQAVAFYCAYGLDFQGFLPHLGWGLKFYLDLLQVTAVGASAPLTPLVAAGLAWAAARLTRKSQAPAGG